MSNRCKSSSINHFFPTTFGFPFVYVPVLSNMIRSGLRERIEPLWHWIPAFLILSIPNVNTRGSAIPKAHGHATIKILKSL